MSIFFKLQLGKDCIDKFMEMQQCFNKFPNLYQMGDKDSDMNELDKELKKG